MIDHLHGVRLFDNLGGSEPLQCLEPPQIIHRHSVGHLAAKVVRPNPGSPVPNGGQDVAGSYQTRVSDLVGPNAESKHVYKCCNAERRTGNLQSEHDSGKAQPRRLAGRPHNRTLAREDCHSIAADPVTIDVGPHLRHPRNPPVPAPAGRVQPRVAASYRERREALGG